MNFKFNLKIVLIVFLAIAVPLLAIVLLIRLEGEDLVATLHGQVDELLDNQLEQIVSDIYVLSETAGDLVQARADESLKVAYALIDEFGGFALGSLAQQWTVVDQLTKKSKQISLPKMHFRDSQLETIQEFVLKLKETTGVDVIVFQKINEYGDLLRIESSAYNAQGNQSVGSFIPYQDANGKPNAIVARLLRDETYHGSVIEASERFLGVYAPIKDFQGEFIGAIFLGFGQDSVGSLQEAIASINVGSRGYAWIVYGQESGGLDEYVVNPNGFRGVIDASNIITEDGVVVFKNLFEKAKLAGEGNVLYDKLAWRTDGKSSPQERILYYTYFPQWDWALGVSAYYEDFNGPYREIYLAFSKIFKNITLIGVSIAVISGLLLLVYVFVLLKPFTSLIVFSRKIIQKDFTSADFILNQKIKSDHQSKNISDETLTVYNAFDQILSELSAFKIQKEKKSQEINDSLSGLVRKEAQIQELVDGANSLVDDFQSDFEKSKKGFNLILEKYSNLLDVVNNIKVFSGRHAKRIRSLDDKIDLLITRGKDARLSFRLIEEHAKKIDLAISAIEKVSEKTNLLALNAAVEAEKAGDSGGGFAIVAREIRKLSDQASIAALVVREVAQQMNGVVEESVVAVENMDLQIESSKDLVVDLIGENSDFFALIESVSGHFYLLENALGSGDLLIKVLEGDIVSFEWLVEQLTEIPVGFLETFEGLKDD